MELLFGLGDDLGLRGCNIYMDVENIAGTLRGDVVAK